MWGWRGTPGPFLSVVILTSVLINRKHDEPETPGFSRARRAWCRRRGSAFGNTPVQCRGCGQQHLRVWVYLNAADPVSANRQDLPGALSAPCRTRWRGAGPGGGLLCPVLTTGARREPDPAQLAQCPHTRLVPRGESGRVARWLPLRPHARGACMHTHMHTPVPEPAGSCTAAARSRPPPAPGTVALSELSNVSGRELIVNTHGLGNASGSTGCHGSGPWLTSAASTLAAGNGPCPGAGGHHGAGHRGLRQLPRGTRCSPPPDTGMVQSSIRVFLPFRHSPGCRPGQAPRQAPAGSGDHQPHAASAPKHPRILWQKPMHPWAPASPSQGSQRDMCPNPQHSPGGIATPSCRRSLPPRPVPSDNDRPRIFSAALGQNPPSFPSAFPEWGWPLCPPGCLGSRLCLMMNRY